MSDVPDTRIEGAARAKPHMVIFEDQPAMLGRFLRNFSALGYEVTGVLVSRADDAYFADGYVKHASLQQALAEGVDWSKRAHLEALGHFKYGVKNRSELRAVLQELKPDVILSDERMRLDRSHIAAEDVMREDEEVIRGGDVMRIAAEMMPDVPRAIHTAIYDEIFKPVTRGEKEKAKAAGHMIFAKDDYEAEEQPQAAAVDKYFRDALQKAKSVGHDEPSR